MTDGIEFKPLGTVEVTFGNKTYTMQAGLFDKFRYFTRRLADASLEASRRGRDLRADLIAAEERHKDNEETPEARAEIDQLAKETREYNFYDYTAPVLAEMFEELGDPLPPEMDNWPVWLATDSGLPARIMDHWRTDPKASGANGAPE